LKKLLPSRTGLVCIYHLSLSLLPYASNLSKDTPALLTWQQCNSQVTLLSSLLLQVLLSFSFFLFFLILSKRQYPKASSPLQMVGIMSKVTPVSLNLQDSIRSFYIPAAPWDSSWPGFQMPGQAGKYFPVAWKPRRN
jgi:hypothetical protein